MRYSGWDPQSIENGWLLDPLIAEVGSVSQKPCRADGKHAQIMCTYKTSPMVNYRIWAENILPMGYDTQFVLTNNVNASTVPFLGIHVHASTTDYQQGKTKLYTEYCKKHGVWFVPEQEESILFS